MTSKVPNPPPDSIFNIDLKPLKAALVDLPPRATIGMRHEQEGIDAVIAEIVNNQPTYGDRAGITATDFTRFTTLNGQFDQIEAQLPSVSKAVEILTESLVYVDNRRHQLASQFASSAESHAGRRARPRSSPLTRRPSSTAASARPRAPRRARTTRRRPPPRARRAPLARLLRRLLRRRRPRAGAAVRRRPVSPSHASRTSPGQHLHYHHAVRRCRRGARQG